MKHLQVDKLNCFLSSFYIRWLIYMYRLIYTALRHVLYFTNCSIRVLFFTTELSVCKHDLLIYIHSNLFYSCIFYFCIWVKLCGVPFQNVDSCYLQNCFIDKSFKIKRKYAIVLIVSEAGEWCQLSKWPISFPLKKTDEWNSKILKKYIEEDI